MLEVDGGHGEGGGQLLRMAVALSVLATPRLLAYQLSTLIAGLRAPAPARDEGEP